MRHVLGLSGGKDSAALAIHMRDKIPEMEYFFCDTGAELPETYDFLDKIEKFLGKRVERLGAERGFGYWLKKYNGFLPSARQRWCTRKLKIEPLEEWLGGDEAVTYIGIRADEPNRRGYMDVKGKITPKFPFVEDGIGIEGVKAILERSGVGMPSYSSWRSRSGCHFCFFQRKSEWIGLKRNHPGLFDDAVRIEEGTAKMTKSGKMYTFYRGSSLAEIAANEAAIMERARKRQAKIDAKRGQMTLAQALDEEINGTGDAEEDGMDAPCMSCHL